MMNLTAVTESEINYSAFYEVDNLKELSLNILDIAQNSLAAKCKTLEIRLEENAEKLVITVKDDGCGMTKETVEKVSNPFYTTRKTRKVGLGIPFFKLAAEQTGGTVSLESIPEIADSLNHGTVISGLFYKTSIDFTPLGDIVSTITTLLHGLDDSVDLVFEHFFPNGKVFLSTSELREQLGDIPLSSPDVMVWISEYLTEQYNEVKE